MRDSLVRAVGLLCLQPPYSDSSRAVAARCREIKPSNLSSLGCTPTTAMSIVHVDRPSYLPTFLAPSLPPSTKQYRSYRFSAPQAFQKISSSSGKHGKRREEKAIFCRWINRRRAERRQEAGRRSEVGRTRKK
eukprot:757658-Hanusia_phi.AAC.1